MSETPVFDLNCEHCGTSLQGDAYTDQNGIRHVGRREIGYSSHDRIQFWICPDCGGTWPRFAPQHPYFPVAEKLRAEFDAHTAAANERVKQAGGAA